MTNHDFDAAIEDIEFVKDGTCEPYIGSICGREGEVILSQDTVNSILFALKLAKKVLGEPSEEMIKSGYDAYEDFDRGIYPNGRFKAMIQQAVKEVEDESK